MAAAPGPTTERFRNWLVSEDCKLSGVDIFARNIIIFPGVTLTLDDCIVKVANCFMNLGTLNAKRSSIAAEKVHAGFSGTFGDLQKIADISDEQLAFLAAAVRGAISIA